MTFIMQSENIVSFIRSTRSNDSNRSHERIRSKNVIDSVVARKSRKSCGNQEDSRSHLGSKLYPILKDLES